MKMHDCIIEPRPTKQDMDEILLWLKKEMESANGRGFYNNRDIIEQSFKSGTMITFKHRGKNIGFVTWSESEEFLINVDIFAIAPSYRGQGYGACYYNAISDFFRSNGFMAIKLFCEPRTSESFWRKMGLVKFPNCGQTQHELTYYGVLVRTASTEYINNTDKIELWDVEPYETEDTEPIWSWYIEIQDKRLIHPIIQPCNCNWNLRWSRNGTVIKEEKVKYFTDEDFELYCSQFLYIDRLRE